MTQDEARERILTTLTAAGVDGADEEQWCTDDRALSWSVLAEAKRALISEGIIQLIWGDFYRLSDMEFARRVLAALRDKACAIGSTHLEVARLDAVAGVLRGLS